MIAFPSNKSCPRCKGEMQYICLTSYPPQYKARCLHCGYEEGNTIQKQTNADRIRAMTDEELATLISENIDCGVCENVFGLRPCNEKCCPDLWLEWLKEEAGE